MSEPAQAGKTCDLRGIREAVCVHTGKITDSCLAKDCIEDLRVYLTVDSQHTLDCCHVFCGCFCTVNLYCFYCIIQRTKGNVTDCVLIACNCCHHNGSAVCDTCIFCCHINFFITLFFFDSEQFDECSSCSGSVFS